MADVATATATGPHIGAYLGVSMAVWQDHIYAGQPNYASYEPGGVHVLTLPQLVPVGAWIGSGTAAIGTSLDVADIDGDGLVEVAVGSPFDDDTGSVILVRGAPEEIQDLFPAAELLFRADDFASRAGTDVLLAALGTDPTQIELIISGGGDISGVDGAIWAIDPQASGSLGEEDALRTMVGPPVFGNVTTALDLDGDGQLDLASSMSDGIGWFSGPWISDITEAERDGVWTLEVSGTNIGHVLESLGDVTGDGGDDLGFSAATHSEDAERAGRAYLVEGGELPADGPVDDLAMRFHGEAVGGGMGWAMASGDVDGDGQLDLMVSASGVFPGQLPGKVLLYAGPVCPAVRTADDADLVIDGEAVYDYFGRTLATTDLDADGLDDMLIAAHGAPENTGNGVIYLVPGSSLTW